MTEMTEIRTADVVGAEIRNLTAAAKYMTVWYAVEIGRRLTEARELVAHGEWLDWLKRETELSQPSASRLMKIYAEYGADQKSLFGAETKYSTLNNLSVSNALRLLAVPEEERESFAAEVDAEHLSARELEQAIRERDEAKRQAEQSGAKLKELSDAFDQRQTALEDAKAQSLEDADTIRELEKQIQAMEKRPVEVAVQVDEEAVKKAAKDATEAADKRWKAKLDEAGKKEADLQKRLETAEKALAEAKDGADKAEMERLKADAERLRRELAVADSAVTEFKVHFNAWQTSYQKMTEILTRATAENADKCRRAVRAVLEQWMKD